jgi:hypothetical protein
MSNRPVRQHPGMRRITRTSRRGTLLVVVLGLLVALFIIGTSFSFVTLAERRAAINYLDRQRALDLALDGVEYTVARLRAETIHNHYEGLSLETGGVINNRQDPQRWAMRPLDGPQPTVTWSRSLSRTSSSALPDGNWIDFDGDGERSSDEQRHATERIPANLQLDARGKAGRVTHFRGDGISTWQVPSPDVPRIEGRPYGPSGTYQELGDVFAVRVVDAASKLNLNNYHGDAYERVLVILGHAIDAWVNDGSPTGVDNPFPEDVAFEMRELAENQGWWLEHTDLFRPIFAQRPNGERLFQLGMQFVTVSSWHDEYYRDYVQSNLNVVSDGNPREIPDVLRMRAGMSIDAANGQDGWPDWQPEPSHFGKAPVNINTAPRPVLVAMLAGIEAKARLLYYKQEQMITQPDAYAAQVLNTADVPMMSEGGTTDLGRQNNHTDRSDTGIRGEADWHPAGTDHRAIFQLVRIGPIETEFGQAGRETASAQRGSMADHAGALADEIIRLRSVAPFQSWQDFDARFFREVLLGLENNNRGNIRVPDLVGVTRGEIRGDASVEGAFPRNLLPDPANSDHPANPFRSGDAGMTQQQFRAWYWKSTVDMLRAALAPSNITARFNADYPYHMNVDRMDLVYSSSPASFSSNGIYEVESVGALYAPPGPAGQRLDAAGDPLPVAQRKIRSVVRIYDVWQHTSQEHFMLPVDPLDVTRQTPPEGRDDETMVSHSKYWTKSGPFSVNELANGSWQGGNRDLLTRRTRAEDSLQIGYGTPDNSLVPPGAERIDRWKGHNHTDLSSGDFGYVTMDPRDHTPFNETRGTNYPLNFHARFNESLRARHAADGASTMQGVLSDEPTRFTQWGHYPLETDVIFEDFVSTATPRSAVFRYDGPEGNLRQSNEFQTAHSGSAARRYSSLRPDGVFLGGGSLRLREETRLRALYNKRGLERSPRLRILRYPNGSHYSNRPFMPIQPADRSRETGIDDTRNSAYNNPYGARDVETAILRLNGTAATNWRGLDEHNRAVQNDRQRLANMPYYEGTVDFWIKWDLPPQGSGRNNVVTSMGEIDPTSLNFSGLFGATAYGRFQHAGEQGVTYNDTRWNDPRGNQRDSNADFEGVQFFVYKEPGGLLRFSRLYFAEAFGADANIVQRPGAGATAVSTSDITNVRRFGNARRRIVDDVDPFSGFTATNDICNTSDAMGFLYSRTDAWVDLNTARYANATVPFTLRTHDWHRFTLSYNSNSNEPYHLWIDGRKVDGIVFVDDPDGTMMLRNDGSFRGPGGITEGEIPRTSETRDEYIFHRTTVRLIEINPEDRLTVGSIFRRQVDVSASEWWRRFFDTQHLPDDGYLNTPPRPLFRFDSNLVAVANATIDDFRISSRRVSSTMLNVPQGDAVAASRYMPRGDQWADRMYFEGGFLPIRDEDGQLYGQPVRLGSLSWTELRPDWDPYLVRGLNLSTSSRLDFSWGVFSNYTDIPVGGEEHDFSQLPPGMTGQSGDMVNTDLDSPNYWARGGISLNGATLPSGQQTGLLVYRAHFRVSDELVVNNVTPYLLDVRVTALTPAQMVWFTIDY